MQDMNGVMARYVRELLEEPADSIKEACGVDEEDNAKAIAKALVDKAKGGDLNSIKEVRVWYVPLICRPR